MVIWGNIRVCVYVVCPLTGGILGGLALQCHQDQSPGTSVGGLLSRLTVHVLGLLYCSLLHSP